MVFFVHGPRASALLVVTTTRTRNRFTPLVWWYCQDAPGMVVVVFFHSTLDARPSTFFRAVAENQPMRCERAK